jgi:hypothetical protein
MHATLATVFITLHFLQNLQRGPISYSVISNFHEKACQVRILQLSGSIRKLQRNKVLGIHNTLFFFVSYKWAQ